MLLSGAEQDRLAEASGCWGGRKLAAEVIFFYKFCLIYLISRQANRLKPSVLNALDKVVWFICTARNAIVVIACLVIASVLNPDIDECMVERENCTFTLTGTSTYSPFIHSDAIIHPDRHHRVGPSDSSAASVWNLLRRKSDGSCWW